MSRQKYRKYTKVRVAKDMPTWMAHFESDFVGIVKGTYKQLYGEDDINSYCLYQLDDAGRIINTLAWYEESQLEYIDYDVGEALKFIEEYE